MKKKINKSLMGTATLAIISTLLLTVAVCYHILTSQILDDLRVYAEMAGVLAEGVNEPVEESYEKVLQNYFIKLEDEMKRNDLRITVIASDGSVVYDTVADTAEMENHGSRPEVKTAFLKGEGSQIRMSDTLDRNTYYYALRLENNTVIRVAKTADNMYRLMEYSVPYVLAVMLVLFAVCGLLSYILTEGIIRPIKLMARDIKNAEKIEEYKEMKPFIDAIRNQHADMLQNAKIRQEFTANVSHELKTPLTAISGYAELIENEMVADGEEVRRFAKEIHGNANRLLTLINDVIRLSELDDLRIEEDTENIDLSACAQACVSMLQISAEKHDVTLSLLEENAVIHASKQMVDEVLYNLCDNAIRYNRKGGSVEVIVKKCTDTAVLIVKDTGIGIPEEHQERIFERFYRVDKSRSKSTGGTGLGLAIVKHILLRLNATITLESEVGEGTTITVVFPIINESGKK